MTHIFGDRRRIQRGAFKEFENNARLKTDFLLIILVVLWVCSQIFTDSYGEITSEVINIWSTGIFLGLLLIFFICKIVINRQLDWGLVMALFMFSILFYRSFGWLARTVGFAAQHPELGIH